MKKGRFSHRTTCRLCHSLRMMKVLDFGWTPLAGDFLEKNRVGKESYYPLRAYFCMDCGYVGLLDIVSAKTLFSDYRYLSSVSLIAHFEEYAKEMQKKFLKKRDFVVEIGSNDGVLLAPFKRMGMRVLGIDPAANVAKIAQKKGLETLVAFFNPGVAKRVMKDYQQADFMCANNVMAHIDDMDKIVDGVQILLKDNGVFVFEVHYLPALIEKTQFDFFYQEHMSYYSLHALTEFFKRHNMEIFDAKRIGNHGGSIRAFVHHSRDKTWKKSTRLATLLGKEKKLGLFKKDVFATFADKIETQKKKLLGALHRLKKEGKTIVGYGASGRGNTLLHVYGIDSSLLDYIVDASPERAGRWTPGSHIPIVLPEVFHKKMPDYALVLAWNYFPTIYQKESAFLKKGGKFIVPLPRVRVFKKSS